MTVPARMKVEMKMSNESLPFVETLVDQLAPYEPVCSPDASAVRAALHALIDHAVEQSRRMVDEALARVRKPPEAAKPASAPSGVSTGPDNGVRPTAVDQWEESVHEELNRFVCHALDVGEGEQLRILREDVNRRISEATEGWSEMWRQRQALTRTVNAAHQQSVDTCMAMLRERDEAWRERDDLRAHLELASGSILAAIEKGGDAPLSAEAHLAEAARAISDYAPKDGTYSPNAKALRERLTANHPAAPVISPASASARAEAMERLRKIVGDVPTEEQNFNYLLRNVVSAARAVLALPEPDPCAGLRDLTGWIADHSFCNGETRQRLLDEGELLDEIRRRIAAGGACGS